MADQSSVRCFRFACIEQRFQLAGRAFEEE